MHLVFLNFLILQDLVENKLIEAHSYEVAI
jgi:hypothetical protein